MNSKKNSHSERLGVLHIEPVGAHGGSHHYDIPLCRAIREAGVEAMLATSEGTHGEPVDDEFILHSYRGIFGKDLVLLRIWRWLYGTLEALNYARRKKVHIVHLHFYGFEPLYFLMIAIIRFYRMKLVITAHDVESFDKNRPTGLLGGWFMKAADGIIAHNMVTRRELLEKTHVKPSRVHVIRHGDHLELLPMIRSRERACFNLRLDPNHFVVVFFGQIKEVKGLDILLKGVAEAHLKTNRKMILVIAGRPWRNDFTNYQNLIKSLEIEKITQLHIRFISDEELPNFYCAANLLVLPYRRIYQSGVLLMAIAFRIPVLVSDLPGMTELIDDHVNGLVFEVDNYHALATKLIWAEAHPDDLALMADRAFDRMTQEHSWSVIGVQTAALYRKIL